MAAGAIVSGAEGVAPIPPAAAYHGMFLLFLLASLGSLAVAFFLVETLGRPGRSEAGVSPPAGSRGKIA